MNTYVYVIVHLSAAWQDDPDQILALVRRPQATAASPEGIQGICICTHVYIYIYISIHTHAYLHTCVCIYIYIYIYT